MVHRPFTWLLSRCHLRVCILLSRCHLRVMLTLAVVLWSAGNAGTSFLITAQAAAAAVADAMYAILSCPRHCKSFVRSVGAPDCIERSIQQLNGSMPVQLTVAACWAHIAAVTLTNGDKTRSGKSPIYHKNTFDLVFDLMNQGLLVSSCLHCHVTAETVSGTEQAASTQAAVLSILCLSMDETRLTQNAVIVPARICVSMPHPETAHKLCSFAHARTSHQAQSQLLICTLRFLCQLLLQHVSACAPPAPTHPASSRVQM